MDHVLIKESNNLCSWLLTTFLLVFSTNWTWPFFSFVQKCIQCPVFFFSSHMGSTLWHSVGISIKPVNNYISSPVPSDSNFFQAALIELFSSWIKIRLMDVCVTFHFCLCVCFHRNVPFSRGKLLRTATAELLSEPPSVCMCVCVFLTSSFVCFSPSQRTSGMTAHCTSPRWPPPTWAITPATPTATSNSFRHTLSKWTVKRLEHRAALFK